MKAAVDIRRLMRSLRYSMQGHPAMYSKRCHTYTGLQQGTLWNGLRTVRILLQEIILEQLYTYAATFPSMPPISLHYQHLLVMTMTVLELLGVASSHSLRPGRSRQGASPFSGGSDMIRNVLSRNQARLADRANQNVVGRESQSTVSGPSLFDPIKSTGTEGTARGS